MVASFAATGAGDRLATWVLLAYRIPREPSTPRISVWRKLRQLGVGHVVDGLVALPLDNRNRERLEWIADEVVEAGGRSTVWIATPTATAQVRDLVEKMTQAVNAEFEAVVAAAREARTLSPPQRRRTVGRLRREMQRIRSRDYFRATAGDAARAAVEELAAAVEEVGS